MAVIGTKTYAVKRYDPTLEYSYGVQGTGMEEYEWGDYVTYEDYQDLEDKLADAEIELKLLKDKIADLFREM